MLENINSDWIDSHLRFVLANNYKRCESEITKGFLGTLEEIDLSGKNISNLKGIQFANNTKSLILNKNNIKNANHLKTLSKLTNLELSENKIEDIFFLSNLKKLKTINLESNNISEIPNLSYLRDLESINISNNRIVNLCFIDGITSKNIRIIGSEQCILLKPVLVYLNSDYTFSPQLFWDRETPVYCDNIQVTGGYENIETNERPSMLYSTSKITIKKVNSDCIIKADFYHETLFLKSGIFSGIVIQQIIVKSSKEQFNIEKLKIYKNTGIIYGSLKLQNTNVEVFQSKKNNELNEVIANRTITLIDSKGETFYSRTNLKGEYEFENLSCGRYTLLYPFIIGYQYLTPSLYIINLKDEECVDINSSIVLD
ncbi:hypothetical protein [Romboutsia sp.]|uniref:hypothetical protein n=1 Tax=Romboutsia sp. TaxID=1965302 RepID=UPI003F340C77